MAIFKGAGVAIVTPMYDNEEVNYDKLEELINWQIDEGTDSIVICGTTGESSTLTMEEHRKVIKAAVDFTKHRVPVVAGTGSNSTRTAIQHAQEAEEDGADGLLIVTPYYNKASQAGLIKHYSEIADNTKLPIILYNVPGRTGLNIPVSVYEAISKIPNIAGVKEASKDITKITHICRECKNFSVWSGNDDLIVPSISLGANGVISVLSNIFSEIIQHFSREFNCLIRNPFFLYASNSVNIRTQGGTE